MIKVLVKFFVFFVLMFKIGTVSFGGATSIWSALEQNFVSGEEAAVTPLGERLDPEQYFTYLELDRLTPGPNINVVLLVGYHYLGLWGMPVAFVALLLPSALILVGLFHCNRRFGLLPKFSWFKEGAVAAVTGIFASFIVHALGRIPREHAYQILTFLLVTALLFILIHIKRVNVIVVTLLSGFLTWGVALLWQNLG